MPDYTPQSSLGLVSNPLGDVINGMLQGHQLALMMQQQQNANQEEQTRQALGQQEIQRNDETARQNLLYNARQVNSDGTVTLDPNNPLDKADPRLNAATPGTPDAAAAGERPTLQSPSNPQQEPVEGTLGLMPGQPPYTVNPPDQAPAATPGQPAAPAATSRLPQANPSQVPTGPIHVKIDPSRLIKFKDNQGNVFQGELYTPQEQAQRQLAAETAKLHIGQTKISIAPEDATKLGLASGDNWIPNADLSTYIKNRQDNEMVKAPPGYPLPMIPRKDYAAALKQGEEGRHDLADEGNTEAGQQNQADIAESNRKGLEARALASQNAANARNAATNSTRLQIAGMPARERPGAGAGTPKPPTNTQLNTIESQKKLAMAKAEGQYQKATEAATVGGWTDPDVAATALANLQKAKQDAQDAYEGKLTQYGLPVEHYEFPAGDTTPSVKTNKTTSAGTTPAGTTPPAKTQPQQKQVLSFNTPTGKTLTVGSHVPLKNGQTVVIKKLYANGTFDY